MQITIETYAPRGPTFKDIEIKGYFVLNGSLYKKADATSATIIFKSKISDTRSEGDRVSFDLEPSPRVYQVTEIVVKVKE